MCYNWGCKVLNHHNSSNSSTIINNSSFNSARSSSVSGARSVSHAHVASGDVDQCFGNDNHQISGINNGVNITTNTHCQNSDLTVLSSMNNSLQSLSVRMEKMERSSTPKPLVPLLLLQAKIYCKLLLIVVPLLQPFPTILHFRIWTLQTKTSSGTLLPLQGYPFASP